MKSAKPTKPKLQVVIGDLPGSGRQAPITQCVVFTEAHIVAASEKALQVRFPLEDRTTWIARSQVCTIDGTMTLDKHSKVGDYGMMLVPKFIVRKFLPFSRISSLTKAAPRT